jgi:hypothetical protein
MAKELFACAPIVLCIALGVGRPACAASPPEITTTLELDTRLLDPDVGARIESQLAEQLGPALAQSGYAVESDPTNATATIRVRVIAFDPDARDYEVEVQVLRPGTEPVGGTVVCNACSESRLVGRIVEDAPGLLERKAEVEEPTLEPADPEPAVESTARQRKVWPIGPMGIAGAGLGLAGIVVAAVGVDRLQIPVVRQIAINRRSILIQDFRPFGATATALGAAALVLGAAMVAVDVKRRRSTGPRYAVGVGPAYVGFQIEHRF